MELEQAGDRPIKPHTGPLDGNLQLDASECYNVVPGGFWVRFVATCVDGMVLSVLQAPFSLVIQFLQGFSMAASNDVTHPLFISSQLAGWIISAVAIYFYYGMFYRYGGATPGKMLFNLRVVDARWGSNISMARTFRREFLGKMLSAILLLGGYFLAGLHPQKLALHDLLSSTRVVRRVK